MQFYGYIMPKLEMVNIKADFLNRNVNEGFSGGEKKRNEILQLAVCIPSYAISVSSICTVNLLIVLWFFLSLSDQMQLI